MKTRGTSGGRDSSETRPEEARMGAVREAYVTGPTAGRKTVTQEDHLTTTFTTTSKFTRLGAAIVLVATRVEEDQRTFRNCNQDQAMTFA